jgi:hypothetical protein
MDLPRLTPAEQMALLAAMKQGFGPCTCRIVDGRQQLCDGHRFLSETQAFGVDRDQISRVARLVYTRREAEHWKLSEFGQPFTLEPPADEPLPTDLFGAPAQGDDAPRLPW